MLFLAASTVEMTSSFICALLLLGTLLAISAPNNIANRSSSEVNPRAFTISFRSFGS